MKRAISRNFDALKRSIVELITPDFRVPLASVAKYSGEFEQQITEARTDEDLKSSLQGIQNSSMRLSRLVEEGRGEAGAWDDRDGAVGRRSALCRRR